ncbi:MAG: threonine aldolase [Myxococcota bacterium]|jgi:threonine aldolase
MTAPDVSPVDLRSDTVTTPTPGMRRAMVDAAVGDACYGEDPTVNRLEAVIAERLGKEKALFVVSGTMGNQLGLATHLRAGDAAMCEATAHIALWEGAGVAALSGAQLVEVAAEDGLPSVAALNAAQPPAVTKAPRLRVLSLENTHNSSGGRAHHPDALATQQHWAREQGLALHLDGARVFNACVATGVSVEAMTKGFDTISVCFSKGLGAPVGSALVGPAGNLAEADRIRHRIGGGWRQAGILAAAALYALEHHVDRLSDDHARATRLGEAMRSIGVARPSHPIDTNLICFEVDPAWGNAKRFESAMAVQGVLLYATGPQTGRLVTHLGVDDGAVDRVVKAMQTLESV